MQHNHATLDCFVVNDSDLRADGPRQVIGRGVDPDVFFQFGLARLV